MEPIEVAKKFVEDHSHFEDGYWIICTTTHFYEFCKEFSESIHENVMQVIKK